MGCENNLVLPEQNKFSLYNKIENLAGKRKKTLESVFIEILFGDIVI